MLRAIPSTSNVCFIDCLIVTHGANGRAVGPLKICWAENLGLQPRLGKRKPFGPKTVMPTFALRGDALDFGPTALGLLRQMQARWAEKP
jgi:hypothetical protein